MTLPEDQIRRLNNRVGEEKKCPICGNTMVFSKIGSKFVWKCLKTSSHNTTVAE